MTEPSNFEHQSPHGELRTAFYNPYDIKRRRRTSRSQFKTLERAFSENPKPNANTRELLAERLSMTPRGIQVWFQNRRAKNKQVNTAAHQTNTNPSADDQPLEDDVGPESDPPLVDAEPGPADDEPSSSPPFLALAVKSFNALDEPPTAKKAQADSVTSEFSSSVLSVESIAIKTDATHFRHFPEDKGPTLDIESSWSRSQVLSANAHRPSANVQSRDAAPALSFSSPSLSALGPTAPQLVDQPRQNVSTPAVIRQEWSSVALQESQGTSKRRNSKTITFQQLPTAALTIPATHRRPSTLSLLRRMSMPSTMRLNNDQERSIWTSQYAGLPVDNLQQIIPHQQPPSYPVNINSNNNGVQPSPFPLHLPPLPQSSRTLSHNVIPPSATIAATSASKAFIGGSHVSPTTFGNMVFSSDSRGHARTYPLSRRVSIHETSFSSSHHGSRHKAVHSLDGLGSTSTLDGTGHTESIAAPIEVQSKRRKSVSKHFRPLGGSPNAGMHVFDASGGVVLGDSPSSFSESPTSVNVPSFMFSPPGQQPRIADAEVSGSATPSTNPLSNIGRQVLPDAISRIEWMEGINLAQQQLQLEGGTVDRVNLSTPTISGGSANGIISSSVQQRATPIIGLTGELLSTQNPHTLAGQDIAIVQGSAATAGGEASSFGGVLDTRKGRRRSSLKTTPRNKSISGARVQFDIQHSSTGTSASAPDRQDSLVQPMQQGSIGAGKSICQDSWLALAMQQKQLTGNISSGNNTEGSSTLSSSPMVQKRSSSPHPPDAFDRARQGMVLSPSLTITAESRFMDQGEAIFWPTAADFAQVGRSEQDSPALDPALFLDSPQSRRNSCPPGLIESFKKDLQIMTDHPTLSNRPPLNQEDVAVLQLQQQLEHNLQLQQHQQRQQHLQQQIQQQLQHHQLQQQQFQQEQQLFFPVQEISSAASVSSSSSSTLASKTDIGTNTGQEQPFGIVFPDGHITERQEQGIGLSMFADSNATLDQESRALDLDTQEQGRMFRSGSGHRHSLTDPYHLPQLQTPRLLAQQQHQVEQPPWSRARPAHSVRPPRSRLSLPVTLQDTHGRRFSEPCNNSRDLSSTFNQQGGAPLLEGNDLSSSAPMTNLYQWQTSQEPSLHGTDLTTNPTLPVKTEEMPLSESLHPLDASANDVQDFDRSAMLLPAFTPSSSNLSATPVLGQHMPVYSFPPAMTASPASSISSSPSPSSSPLASRDMRELPYGSATSASPMSDNGAATHGAPSPPVWGTPSSVAMAIALSPSTEAPLLMRAHSLDSLMLQQNSVRESPTLQVGSNSSLTSPRRHSQGPSSTVSVEQAPQAHTPISSQFSRHELLQTQQQQSYFPSPVFVPPLPLPPSSPNTSKNALSVHPLDQHGQQHHLQQLQQQQQYFMRQGQGWNAAFPVMFPSPQPMPPLAMQHSQQGDTLNQGGSPTIVLPSERLQQTISWEQNQAAMNHLAILQQKLPLARQQQQLQDSQTLLHTQVQSSHQQLYLQQLQQQQSLLDRQQQRTTLQDQQQQSLPPQVQTPVQASLQQHPLQEQASLSLPLTPAPLTPEQFSTSPTHSFAPNPALTVPSFKDAKELEEYKHQQFILEHQRLQQRQELELEALKEQNGVKLDQESNVTLQGGSQQQQQPDRSLGFDASTATSKTARASGAAMTNRLTGHVAIATALVLPSSPMLSSSALKDS